MARIMRQCKMHQKNFALKDYGSWEAAEAAASAWIDKQKKILPPSQMNAKDRMTSRNRSGVVGVYLSRQVIRRPSGKEYEYWRWTARWPGCPQSGGVSWQIGESLEEDDAFALAVLSRQMESTDRYHIMSELARIYGSKRHLKIMAKKQIAPE